MDTRLNTLHNKMAEKVASQVEAYKTDFTVHDTAMLEESEGLFLWITRPCGTHLFFKSRIMETIRSKGLENVKDWAVAVLSNEGMNKKAHYYLGNTLTQELKQIRRERFSRYVDDWSREGLNHV